MSRSIPDPDDAPQKTLKQKIMENEVTQGVVSFFGWVQEQIWPVYSVGMVVAAVALVGAVYEKQVIADYAFGSMSGDQLSEVQHTAAQSMDDEAAHLVRQEVFAWNRAKFRREAAAADI